jgi:hypothetical protein
MALKRHETIAKPSRSDQSAGRASYAAAAELHHCVVHVYDEGRRD